MGSRKELGYILCHQGDNAVVRLLPSGRRAVIRSGHFTPLEKSPAIIKLIEDSISSAQKQRFNELLGEIEEHYGLHDSLPGETSPPTVQVAAPAPPPDDGRRGAEGQTEEAGEEPINFFGAPVPAEQPFEPTFAVEKPSEPTSVVDDSPAAQQTVAHQPPEAPTASVLPPLRRSQRSSARKPPGFYAEATSAESVRDYIACHMSAKECATIYGKEAQEAAGADEVINIIGRKALNPRNSRELTAEELKRVLPSFLFYKAKDLLPSEVNQDDPSNQTWTTVQSKREKRSSNKKKKRVKIKGRWVGGGHKQKKHEALRDRVAPTARSTTHAIVLAIAAKEKRLIRVGDMHTFRLSMSLQTGRPSSSEQTRRLLESSLKSILTSPTTLCRTEQ